MIRLTKKRLSCLGLLIMMGCGSGDLPTVPPIPADHKQLTPAPTGVVPRPRSKTQAPTPVNNSS